MDRQQLITVIGLNLIAILLIPFLVILIPAILLLRHNEVFTK